MEIVVVGSRCGRCGRRAIDDDLLAVLTTPDDPRGRFAGGCARQRHVVAFIDGDVARTPVVDNVRRHLDLDAAKLLLHYRRVDLWSEIISS